MKHPNDHSHAPLERCVSRPLAFGMSAVCAVLTVLAALSAYPFAAEAHAVLWLILGAALVFAACEAAIFLLLRFVGRRYLRPVSNAIAAVAAGAAEAAAPSSPTSPEADVLLRAVREMGEQSAGCLADVEQSLRRMADGDFSPQERGGQNPKSGGIYAALEEANQAIRGTLGALRTALEQLTGPLVHLEENVSELEQSDRERQSWDGLLRALERLTMQLRQRSEGAANVSSAADGLRQKLVQYDRQQRELAQAVNRISDCANEAGKIVKDMETASFQCSVLARTAYVEAAGAGINGKGFAVVASELRVLASRSAQAAQDAAVFMDEMRRTIREGAALAEAVSRELQAVSASGSEVCRKAAGAAQNAAQTKDLQEVAQQVNRLEALSEDTREHAGRIVQTAQVLQKRFDRLREMLRFFQLHSG